jgi:TetR/AcrR family transcriptional regulator
MARVRRSPDAKPRREEILDAATRLFAELGYDGTRMSELASEVGVKKSSLFYHFPSKDLLYAAVLDRVISAVVEAVSYAGANEGTSFVERLDALTDAVTTVLTRYPYAARLALREAMDWGPVAREKLADSVQLMFTGSAAFLEAGQDAGVFARCDARQLVLTLAGAHFLTFGIGPIAERFVGCSVFEPEFVEARRRALREQVRALVGIAPVRPK